MFYNKQLVRYMKQLANRISDASSNNYNTIKQIIRYMIQQVLVMLLIQPVYDTTLAYLIQQEHGKIADA